MEKIKVNLSYSNYHTLAHDAETFCFLKSNGDVNKNLFYNEVVKALYIRRWNKIETLRTYYRNELNKYIDEKSIVDDLVSKITHSINNANNDFKNQYHEFPILIRPSKSYEEIYETIFENHLVDDTISNYFRSLFYEYCSLDQDEREIIIFSKQYNHLLDAITDSKIIKIKVAEQYHKFIPYGIVKTKEKLFNYLIGYILTKNNEKKLMSFHLYKITNILDTDEIFTLEDHEIKKLDELVVKGPQYVVDYYTSACIELTKEGMKLWKNIYLNRPLTTKIEDNKLYFNCSFKQLVQYFIRFGKEAKVIYPNTLKNKIKHFYIEALSSIK